MKKILIFTSVLTLGCFIYFIPVSMSVEICHSPPGASDDWQTISVDFAHLQFHLDHGDLLGACDTPCEVLCDDGNPCTNDQCDPAGGCIHSTVDCNDGRACTDDFCNQATGLCDYEEDCEGDFDCGYNSGECVACPQEVRHVIDAAIGVAARMRKALQVGSGEGAWCYVLESFPDMPGWPTGIQPKTYMGSWSFPNIEEHTINGLAFRYMLISAYEVLGEEPECYEPDTNPSGYVYSGGYVSLFHTSGLQYHLDGVPLQPVPDMLELLGSDTLGYQCAQDVDPVLIDQQIICAQKVARELSDFGEPCLESAP